MIQIGCCLKSSKRLNIFRVTLNQPLQKAIRRVNVCQVGYMKNGLKRRRVQQLFIHSGVEICPVSPNHSHYV